MDMDMDMDIIRRKLIRKRTLFCDWFNEKIETL